MKILNRKAPKWSSPVFNALAKEIEELTRRFEVEMKALQKAAAGSDEYITHWSEAAVILSWLHEKTEDLIAEMERLELTWPE